MIPTAENASEESPLSGWNTSGCYEITSRTDTGLNVEGSGRRLDHRWWKGCRLSQPTLETAQKRGPLKYEPLLAVVPNPEEADQRRRTRRYVDGPWGDGPGLHNLPQTQLREPTSASLLSPTSFLVLKFLQNVKPQSERLASFSYLPRKSLRRSGDSLTFV